MKIGSTIRELRKAQGFKQGEFAALIKISSTALSQIERDESIPKSTTLDKICDQLNVTSTLIYLLSVGEKDIPIGNRDKYLNIFPHVRDLIITIFSEDEEEILLLESVKEIGKCKNSPEEAERVVEVMTKAIKDGKDQMGKVSEVFKRCNHQFDFTGANPNLCILCGQVKDYSGYSI